MHFTQVPVCMDNSSNFNSFHHFYQAMFIQQRIPYRADTKKTYPKCGAREGIPHSGIRNNFARGIQNLENFSCATQIPGLLNKEYGSTSPDILLTIGIRSSTDKESGTQYKESGIHSMEYRILDFIGFPYMERYVALHLRDRSKAVALRYRHRVDITVFILEQKPYPV